MEVIETSINGVYIIKPKVFTDDRGYFFESFSKRSFSEKLKEIEFVQDNESKSTYGVVRGLHFQRPPFAQSKLVRCVKGSVLDVALDIRVGSPTYGKHISVNLNESNQLQLFIPQGFAHGFSVLSETAIFQYKCDNYYCPESEGGILATDSLLDINWGIENNNMIISPKDLIHKHFSEFDSPFKY